MLRRWHNSETPWTHGFNNNKKPQNYILEGGPLIVQASSARWVFYKPSCISVPAGLVVRGCVWLQWIFLRTQCICPFHEWFMNTSVHTALSVQQFLTKNGMTPVPHPPYSPSLTLSKYFLFLWMEKVLKGKLCADVEGLKQKTAEALQGIKINEFKNCFEQRIKYLDRCTASNGEYFEGEWSLKIKNKYTFFISKFWFWGVLPLKAWVTSNQCMSWIAWASSLQEVERNRSG